MRGRLRVDVQKLLDRLGIEGKRKGRYFEARCPSPVHEDRNPSWRISLDGGQHQCFSCGFYGGAVKLVMSTLGVNADAAVKWILSGDLAAPQVLEVEVEVMRPVLRGGFKLPAGVIIAPLVEWPGPARDYASSRGLTVEQVDRWGIGYAVDGRLAGRIVFPVRDREHRLISYTARTFVGDRKRYLEPKASEGSVEGAVFGEEHAVPDSVIVVTEGALDALAVERAIPLQTKDWTKWSVAAIYGSGVLPAHLNRLAGKYLGVVVVTDSDPAGDRAADEIQSGLGRWMRVRRWRPPEGWDCCKLATSGRIAEVRDGVFGAWASNGLQAHVDR